MLPAPLSRSRIQVFAESSTIGVESVLNQMPQFNPGFSQFTTGDIFPSATNTPGAATLNLRGLGANRNLVLIDGRRGQPANSTLVIDTNTIPSSMIDSVEIISGGALGHVWRRRARRRHELQAEEQLRGHEPRNAHRHHGRG